MPKCRPGQLHRLVRQYLQYSRRRNYLPSDLQYGCEQLTPSQSSVDTGIEGESSQRLEAGVCESSQLLEAGVGSSCGQQSEQPQNEGCPLVLVGPLSAARMPKCDSMGWSSVI